MHKNHACYFTNEMAVDLRDIGYVSKPDSLDRWTIGLKSGAVLDMSFVDFAESYSARKSLIASWQDFYNLASVPTNEEYSPF